MNISVIGLGKLGSVLAAVLAHKGHTVVGVDINDQYVTAINHGQAPVEETGLQELIDLNKTRLSATQNFEHAVMQTDVSMIIVPTPSNAMGVFSLQYVQAACDQLAINIAKKNKYHLIVVVSTVMPGDTEQIQQVIEQTAGLTCGVNFGLCYNPEFIALGDIINHMLHPDMILIGENDAKAGDLLESIYRSVVENSPKYVRTNFVNAELIKISVNTFVTTKISYANMLGEICDQLPNANIDVITDALGADRRIGPKYLKAAVPFGGPCFPRDNVAFSRLAHKLGVSSAIADATQLINERQIDRLFNLVVKFLPQTVGVLGLSYKAGTNFVEKSTGIKLIGRIRTFGFNVVAHDPEANANAAKEINEDIFVNSIQECVTRSNVIVIATEWPQFKTIDPSWLTPNQVIVDCWGLLDPVQFSKVCTYIRPGVNVKYE